MGYARPLLSVIGMTVALSCATPAAPPPVGEVLLVIDTDAPVPMFVSRLRVDLYAPDASRWYESRDVERPDPADWPASFAVTLGDAQPSPADVLVRLRAYADGAVRDYEGERFVSRTPSGAPGDTAIPPPPDGDTPRLLDADGNDATPSSEPEPYLAIDRLLLVHVLPDTVAQLPIVLRGACFGTMADIYGLQTCIDTDSQLVDVTPQDGATDLTPPAAVAEDFGAAVPCPDDASPRPGGGSLYDEEVCVPGGAFVFGNVDQAGYGDLSGVPPRVALVSPFYLDRYEVTVAAWHDALARGFVSPDMTPTPNDAPLVRDDCQIVVSNDSRWCTFTRVAGQPEAREDYPLNCVSWNAARAYCRFRGGDLPTEAEWEYVAQSYGSAVKSTFPWGDDAPSCSRAVFSRIQSVASSCAGHDLCRLAPGATTCATTSCTLLSGSMPLISTFIGPQPVDAAVGPQGDTSLLLGVYDLAGSMSELTRDAMHSLASSCWAAAPMLDPECDDPTAPYHTVRGGSWEDPGGPTKNGELYGANIDDLLLAGQRHRDSGSQPLADFAPEEVGFRCMRPVAAP